jgi:phosphatidyl-myo-inositol dimannoside synthase
VNVVLTPGMAGTDGVAALSRLVVRGLAQAGEPPVEVLSLHDVRPPDLGPAARCATVAVACGSKTRLAVGALRLAARADAQTRVICVHLHLGPLALPLVWRGARLATILCGIEAWRPLSRVRATALRHAETLVAISAHTARRFRAANPSFADRVVQVCHPAVAAVADSGAHGPPTAAPPSALIVARMAACERYKGHDLLLDVWPRVLARVPEARLIVAGDGDDRARLEARAAALALTERVQFLGHVSDEMLTRLYRDCTFFVMPSRDEGFGLVFLEAMRAGKACVGGNGAAAEIIQDGVTGLVVDPQEPQQVFSAVVRLFEDAETRERMGRAAAERCAREFAEARFRERFRAALGLQSES